MTDKERELQEQWERVNRQLEDLANGRALPENTDPTVREQELLGELDRIEWERGQLDLERRRTEGDDDEW